MGTHGSMTIYTASDESDDPEQSAYLIKLHTTHDGNALDALRDALTLPFLALQDFENEAALALARGEIPRRCDWKIRMALASTLIPGRARHSPTSAAAQPELNPEDRGALFLSQAFELCRDGAENGHWFSADPTELCNLMIQRGSAGWFSLPHQLDQDTADYWGSEPDIVIESGSTPLTRVSIAWPDPEDEEGCDKTLNSVSRWVNELNAALSPFSLYEIERREDGISVQYPFELAMGALMWHRAFAGGRLEPVENEDGPYGSGGQQSAMRAAFGLDPSDEAIPDFGELAFCFSSSTSASKDRGSVWASVGEFTGARRPGAEALIDQGGALIAIDFLRFEEPLIIRGALKALADLHQRSEPGALADWLRSIMAALPKRTGQSAPEALAFLEQADLNRTVAVASSEKTPAHSI